MNELTQALDKAISDIQEHLKTLRSSTDHPTLRKAAQIQRGLNLLNDGYIQILQANAVNPAAITKFAVATLKPHSHGGIEHTHE